MERNIDDLDSLTFCYSSKDKLNLFGYMPSKNYTPHFYLDIIYVCFCLGTNARFRFEIMSCTQATNILVSRRIVERCGKDQTTDVRLTSNYFS
jgi:hypothetical protein